MKKLLIPLGLILSLLSSLVLSLACSRHEPLNDEDHFRRIQTQIEKQEYVEAEKDLQAILQSQPQNQRARMILASLYVRKAGITLDDYFQLERLSRLDKEPKQLLLDFSNLKKIEVPANSDYAQMIRFLEQLNLAVTRFQEISDKFDHLPVVSDEGSENLVKALIELEKIEQPSNGQALFRGVIKLYYFKYLWQTGKFLEFGERRFCSQTVGALADRLGKLEIFIVSLLRDVAHGFPEKSAGFQKQISKFDWDFRMAKAWLKAQKESQLSVAEITEKIARSQKIEGFQCDF